MNRRVFCLTTAGLTVLLAVTMAASFNGRPDGPALPPAALGQAAGPAGTVSRHVRKPVNWVALNPEFAGASFVNDPATCLGCHEDSGRTYDHTVHAAALRYAPGSEGRDCESCHGPRSQHVEEPTDVLSYERLTSAGLSAICLQCHDGGARFGWKAGPHHAGEVSCMSCHLVMEKRSDRGLLARTSSTQLCYTCHAEVRADTMKTSHHPVREGRLECASCHNAHGATEALLVKNTINDTCVSCHTDKRGPFLWEHAPVREDCTTCHTPHGSNQRFMLTNREPFLCLTCHSYGGHVNLPRYNRTSNPYGNGCTNCHITTHGSNHPSGAKQTR